ncbi:MAG: type IV pilus secretin PilQ [Betaproteobacteria bacterium]|nr:type IV pilus secretin PilQ [Betaproteobacteria bacterium]MDH3437140.1 type IV pilus secretin PilQ [Betaproteobacteria bacterium]
MSVATRFVPPILRVVLAAIMVAGSVAAYAQSNTIQGISVSPQAGGKLLVKVSLKEAPVNPPAGFTINNPPRIAFDFLDTNSAMGRATQEIGEGDLRSINVVQAGNRTRLVLNLNRVQSYDTQIEGQALLITLQGAASAAAPTGVTTHFAEAKPVDSGHTLRDIDFRRGRSGEGRVVVDLSDSAVGINLKQQGRAIVIDFINTALPNNLKRRMDVTDFGTPVKRVDAFSQGNNTRVVIEPSGNWEHTAYQTDTRFIVEVKQIVEDPNRLVRPGFTGEKLSLNFQNVEVRAVLQVIADFTGLNIITSDTVTGNLTLRLKDVPWDQALDIILQSKGLDLRKTGNVVWIAPRDELATREKLALEAKQQIADLEPTRTEIFQLNYQKAEAFRTLLTDDKQRILSKRGSAVIDTRTNTVFVQDTPTHLEEVRTLIQRVDIPVRQVMIESRIVEATDQFARNLGVRLGYHDQTGRGTKLGTGGANKRILGGGSLADTGFHTGQSATVPVWPTDSLSVNLPAQGIAGALPGAFSLLLFNQSGTKFLNLELTALQADGKGKIISSPRVITADQVEAIIEQGTEIPYQQATSSGATSVSFKKATLSLKVKPQITPDDNVIMNVDVHKDSVGQQTLSGPSIDTKQITTEVLVSNGGTVVIGGIYTQEERSTTSKVPVLGDLPYVGFLFKQNQKQDDRTELLIFITPKVIKDNVSLRR